MLVLRERIDTILTTWLRGAVVINDVTARERQRDHKQFYVGKSLDTFCPMVSFIRRA